MRYRLKFKFRGMQIWLTAAARYARLPQVLLPLVLLAVACSNGAATGATTAQVPAQLIDPMAEFEGMVVDGPILEIGSTSVSVRATTREKTVCAVSYGPTTDYGRIATDDAMDVGGHKDHHPVLIGLEPNTLYHYSFGGIGPDGKVFRSPDFTFRTLPADAGVLPEPEGENLAALGAGARVLAASSNFGGGDFAGRWGANSAFDGDLTTQWSSDGDGDGAWIEIELAAETHVTSLGFWTRTMGESAQIFSFQVETDRGEVAGPFRLSDASSVHYFETDLTARRLKFQALETSGGNTGAVEILVYGSPVP